MKIIKNYRYYKGKQINKKQISIEYLKPIIL